MTTVRFRVGYLLMGCFCAAVSLATSGCKPSDGKKELVEDYAKLFEDISLAIEANAPQEEVDNLRKRTFEVEARSVKLGLSDEEKKFIMKVHQERMVVVAERIARVLKERPMAGADMAWAMGGPKVDAALLKMPRATMFDPPVTKKPQ